MSILKNYMLVFFAVGFLILGIVLSASKPAHSDPIYHEVHYPHGEGPFPVVIVLHTSNGFKTVKRRISKYTNAGYAVYAPDFFKNHGISHSNRFDTWTIFRKRIEFELTEIVGEIKKNPITDNDNIFAVGFSNGGYWAAFLAANGHVNAAAAHYGVWSWPPDKGWDGYPANYFSDKSNPVLAIHGKRDTVQKPHFVFKQLAIIEDASKKFEKYFFSDAGHSWDCKPCKKDGHNSVATRKALELTLNLFEKNKRR